VQPFFERSVAENLQPKATAEIAVHLCWDNEELSKAIILACTEGIDKVGHDLFPPYLQVLTPLLALKDSWQESRVNFGMKAFIRVMDNNAQYKMVTIYSVKYLLEIAQGNKVAADYLLEHKGWIEKYLFSVYSEVRESFDYLCLCTQVREATSELILALIPYPSPYGEDNQPLINPRELQLASESQNRLHLLYSHLLKLFTSAPHYWKPTLSDTVKSTADCDIGAWKLVHYFRLLQWLTRSQAEKAIVSLHTSMQYTNTL
jgi:hypothetical protein